MRVQVVAVVAFQEVREVSKRTEDGEVLTVETDPVYTTTSAGTGFSVAGYENRSFTAGHVLDAIDPFFPKSADVVRVRSATRVITLPILEHEALPAAQKRDLKALLAAGGREAVSYKSLQLSMRDQAARLAKEEISARLATALNDFGTDVAVLSMKPVEPSGTVQPGFPVLTGQVARVPVKGKVAVSVGRPKGRASYITLGHPFDDRPATFPQGPIVRYAEAFCPSSSPFTLKGASGGPVLVPVEGDEEGSGGEFPFTLYFPVHWCAVCLYNLILLNPLKSVMDNAGEPLKFDKEESAGKWVTSAQALKNVIKNSCSVWSISLHPFVGIWLKVRRVQLVAPLCGKCKEGPRRLHQKKTIQEDVACALAFAVRACVCACASVVACITSNSMVWTDDWGVVGIVIGSEEFEFSGRIGPPVPIGYLYYIRLNKNVLDKLQQQPSRDLLTPP